MVIPSIDSDHIDKGTGFYCFNKKEYLENGSMHHWVFGHGHTYQRFHRACTRQDGKTVDIHCNSIGQLILLD